MPYIKQDRREAIDGGEPPETAGELTYAMAVLVNRYLTRRGHSFDAFGEVWAAFSSARFEFERRTVAGYEQGKIAENGDVPGYGPTVDCYD